MDDFARRSAEDRQAYIDEAAARRDLTSIIIEKDFWVCWTLRRLMAATELTGQITFKGGTSLSKAYGIIQRFSEDIDLTINRAAPLLRDAPSPMETGISGKERVRRTVTLKNAAKSYVAQIAMPALAREIETALDTAQGWSLLPDPEDQDEQTLLFVYPRSSSGGPGNDGNADDDGWNGYIKPRIKLEFGARGDPEPAAPRILTPYLAEDFPEDLPDASTEVPTLAAERTFWEKATILHALHHNGKLRPGLSRHYYDLLELDRAGITQRALAQPDLLAQVVRNKSVMFTDGSASYQTAALGTLRLLPTKALRADLQKDYAAMAEMFMSVPPTFTALMDELEAVERTLNDQRHFN